MHEHTHVPHKYTCEVHIHVHRRKILSDIIYYSEELIKNCWTLDKPISNCHLGFCIGWQSCSTSLNNKTARLGMTTSCVVHYYHYLYNVNVSWHVMLILYTYRGLMLVNGVS